MIRKITKEDRELASKEPIYKVVRDEGGKLKSLFVTGTKKNPEAFGEYLAFALTYKENKVISNGDFGIWCCKTLEEAKWQVRDNGAAELCKIYKVFSIGSPITPPKDWNCKGAVLYPSIIMSDLVKTIDRRW